MIHFSRDDDSKEISFSLSKIRTLSSKIEQKITQKGKDGEDTFIETLSVEELKDLRQVILASEYLLTKYQDKKDLKNFLEEFIGVIMHAANSVNTMRDELEDLVISAEVAMKQIQNLHDEVTQNLALGRFTQTKLDEYGIPAPRQNLAGLISKSEENPVLEPSPINLTNSASRVNTRDYLERTPVEI